MLFSTPFFCFAFFPAFFLLYFLIPEKRVVLFAGSLLFYAWGEPVLVFVVLASSVLDWILGKLISFTTGPGRLMSESGQFGEVVHFSYLSQNKILLQDGKVHVVRTPAAPIDYGSEIFSADALVLELNEFFWGGCDWVIELPKATEDYFGSKPGKKTFP